MSEEFYGASADATLEMGSSTATPLPAFASDTYTEVPLLVSVTPPPREKSAASFYILNDRDPRSVAGRTQDKEVPGNVVVDHSEAVHDTLREEADGAEQKRNWRLTYPDGHVLYFVGFVRRWAETALDASGEPAPHRADFIIRVSGATEEA